MIAASEKNCFKYHCYKKTIELTPPHEKTKTERAQQLSGSDPPESAGGGRRRQHQKKIASNVTVIKNNAVRCEGGKVVKLGLPSHVIKNAPRP